MALVIAGRILPLDRAHEGDLPQGRVWLGDDGLIDTVTKDSTRQRQPDLTSAPVVDACSATR